MSQHFESAEELTAAMAMRSPKDALSYLNDWLERRDTITHDLTTDDLVLALELLAAELRREAARISSPLTPGLSVAASFLTDSARDTRAGQRLDQDGNELPG